MASHTSIHQFTAHYHTMLHRSATSFLLLLLSATTFSHGVSLTTHALWQPQPPAGSNTASCIGKERDALLAFKQGITSDPEGDLASWNEDQEDCCRWRGVQCSNATGHVLKLRLRNKHADPYGNPITPLVGQISQSLLALERLEYLDLSSNHLEGTTGRIPEFLGSLKNLKYLNLSGNMFSDKVPSQLGNLSNLQYLDLSGMDTYSTDVSWLTRLSFLEYLSLDSVELRIKDDWPRVVNMLPSLRVIVLSDCLLSSANQSLGALNLTNLQELDVSYNFFNHPVASCWFWNLTSLTYLDLGFNHLLYGQLPNALGDMTLLHYLSLSDIKTSVSMIMARLNNLCNLRILYLDSCFTQGNIVDLVEMLPQCSLNKLQRLSLESNQLTGALPKVMEQLTNLVVLDLSDNNITGPVPAFIRSMAGLVVLDLSSNKMEGPIPKFIRQFTSLRTLDLSNNHLNGSVPYEIGMLTNMISLFLNNNHLDGVIDEGHFANVRSLYYIDLSYNSFKIELSSEWRPPFRLCMAHFASCQMGPLFPAWLQWQVDIIEIVISSAGIIDKFPHWFCSSLPNLLYLNMSDNQLYGDLPLHMGNMSLDEVYLSSNLLTGQVPPLPITLTHLDISKNSLSGPLPSNFGSPKLAELSLFSNRITGGIPRSLICQCEELEILDLANNYFEGELPSCAGIRAIKNIELSHNSFFGEFPSFLENCTALQFLDLAGNKFFGRLPPWIGNLVRLQFLRLSHNMFSGNIPTNLTNLACLKYLDVAGNGISGLLPRHIWNLKSMRQKHWEANPLTCIYSEPIEYHSVSLYATTKGQQRDYGSSGRIMDLNTIYFDLSSNYLTGELPEELASLDLLRNLNLSRNNFTGNIANSVGAMQFLESLDLSRNDLSGEIPESLSNMTFLSYLDMSYNNLTGRIPSGSQLDTLYAAYPSMYAGNIGLCGPPLKNNCTSTDASKQDHYTRTEQGHGPEFFYLGLICGIIAGILVVYCSLLLK